MPAAPIPSWLIHRRSKTGRSERIGGNQVKLCSGGGEVVAHSSEFACHGSAPTVRGPRRPYTTAIRNGTIEAVNTTKPIDDTRFQNSNDAMGS